MKHIGNYKHGDSVNAYRDGCPEYTAWQNMRERCKPDYKQRADYFDRGIGVCPKWQDYAVFLVDVGRRPSPAHSLDRIDNARGYWPGNVRWATRSQQNANTLKARVISVNGAARSLTEWARAVGISPSAILGRIKRGMTPEQAVTAPPDRRSISERKRALPPERRSALNRAASIARWEGVHGN